MTPERWQRIKELFETALELEAEQRAAFLERACGEDSTLRSAVESLIVSHEEAGEFLISPAVEDALQLLTSKQADNFEDNSNLFERTMELSEAVTLPGSEVPTMQGEGLASMLSNQQSRMFPVSNWDRYEFIKLLGEGGMGRVYLAKDPRLKRKVALKFLSRDNAELNERFTKEAQTQAKIEHEHICKVHEVGEVEGHRYIAMQYIDGQSLKDAMNQMSLEQKVKVMKEVAEALHAAHRNGLIHRDIKPANIMVEQGEESKWQPTVMDFGLAKEMDVKGRTVTGAIMGTPAYMPPEQAEGKISQLDRRSDVYSLGATLYELLVGRPPFDGTSVMEIIFKIVDEEPEPIRKLNSSIPLDLETIVMKCLAKEPERRYATAKLLAEDLGRYLDGEPIQARPTSWIYRTTKRAKKQKAVVAVSALALMVVIVLAGVSLYSRWMTAEQAKLLYFFGQQMKEAETNLRSAYLLPLHDTKLERNKIREQIKNIETEMNRMGRVASGPGHYAIGRGYFALREYEAAREHLDKAWQGGYRPPEVAYSLWQVIGGLYEKKLAQTRKIGNKELREARIKEIEKEYLNPALEYLKASGGLQMETPEYKEALIAFYKGEYDDALKKASLALEQVPSLYEAKKLQGDIYLAIGDDKHNKGDYEGEIKNYEYAGQAYGLAMEMARSDSTIYEEEAKRWSLIMGTELDLGHSSRQALDQALSACDKALQANGENEAVYVIKSRVYYLLSEYQIGHGEEPTIALERSLEAAQKAIQINPTDLAAYNNLGSAYQSQGEYERGRGLDPRPSLGRAIESYQKATQIDPNYAAVYNNLGNTYVNQGIYESGQGLDPRPSLGRAIESYQKATQINPNDFAAYNNLGNAYKNQGEYESGRGLDPRPSLSHAIESYQKATQINPNNAAVYNNLGSAYDIQGEYESGRGLDPRPSLSHAIESYQKATQINPNSVYTYNGLGNAYKNQGEYESGRGLDPRPSLGRAIESYQKTTQINPNHALAYYNLGSVYQDQGEYESGRGLDPRPFLGRAIESCRKATQINPRYAPAYYMLASAYLDQGEYEIRRGLDPTTSIGRAIESCQKAAQINPNDAYVYYNLGNAYLDQGEYESRRGLDPQPSLGRAIESYQKATQINPNNDSVYNNLGYAYMASARYEIGHEINPTDSLNRARTALEQALKLNSQDADVYASISKLHRYRAEWVLKGKQRPQEDIEQGLKMAEKALSINPQMAEAVADQGALYLLQARVEQDSRKRVETSHRAQGSLEQALKMNSLLQHEYEPLLTEARKLIAH